MDSTVLNSLRKVITTNKACLRCIYNRCYLKYCAMLKLLIMSKMAAAKLEMGECVR